MSESQYTIQSLNRIADVLPGKRYVPAPNTQYTLRRIDEPRRVTDIIVQHVELIDGRVHAYEVDNPRSYALAKVGEEWSKECGIWVLRPIDR